MQISQGREKEAIATYGDVLEIYENSEDKDGVLETLDMLAGLLVSNQKHARRHRAGQAAHGAVLRAAA